MTHEIETNGTEAAFFSAREIPWHNLGTITPDALTAEDAMRVAHLDWTVEKSPLYATTPGGLTVPVPGKFATTRTNPFDGKPNALGVVGDRYTVVQNIENASFLNALVDESGAHFETAGSLDNGRKVFVTMKAPKGLMIGGRDAVDLYLVASNSHDGSSPFVIDATPIRVVCANTLRMGHSAARGTFRVRHSGNVGDKVAAAQEALGVMWDYAAEFEHRANELLSAKMNDSQFRRFVDNVVFPVADDETDRVRDGREAKAKQVFDLWKYAPTQEDVRNTKWAAYNAVAEWIDWKMPIRKEADRAQRIADDPLLDRMKDKVLTALA